MTFKREYLTNLILFILTVFTTVFCGTVLFGGNIKAGVVYSFCALSIFFIHEMGHYINAKRHGIEVTLPYFIPFPIGIGTMGAVIKMKSSAKDRNALMDVGAAGPLWGFGAALVTVILGMAIAPVYDAPVSKMLGPSLLYTALAYLIKGVSPDHLGVTPVLFAGWLGFFLTMINMLPIGQLDGGHVFYALFGKSNNYRKHMKTFFYAFLAWGVVCFIVYNTLTWIIFGLLLTFMGGAVHPPLDNEMVDLTLSNRIKGWGCIVMFIVTAMPVPFRA